MPQPFKVDLPEKKLHNDNLPEQHFTDLRLFLIKKHRQEAIAAKMSAKTARAFGSRAAKTATAANDDYVG